ncbi:glutaminase A [Rubrivivax sp. RP6-9]|uniref:glutaminase A n=1 Tax=Rubrivivax sp. RP6-9 TaxID=3415750 RepID=UPI003CC642EE
MLEVLQQLHARCSALTDGAVATYIPELAKADPAWFGIVIATVDGQVYEVGTTRQPFTLQSISKPLVYGVALEDVGPEAVQRHVGVEPSGEAFNAISLEPGSGRPMNPMINAGAIATAALVQGATPQARLARVVDAISAYAGRPLQVDEAVFASERDTGHRNRAIGHLLRNAGILQGDPEPALELYFRQCSLLVDCRDLALMAATLANGGMHPLTGRRAVAAEHVGPILSVMTTCGVYDLTGEWVYSVGMPAKSGVGGGIIAVLPGQLGIGVFSPALDARGNSVRGVAVCKALSQELGLHFLQPPRAATSTVRAHYTLATMRSKRRRPAADNTLLDQHGGTVVVFELQGDLRFATLEPVLRAIAAGGTALHCAVLDFKRVGQADDAATRLLAALAGSCAARGQQLVLTRVRRGDLLADFGNALHPRHAGAVHFLPQLDLGLEWCEKALLARVHGTQAVAAIPGLADHRWCTGLGADEVALLESVVERQQHAAGSLIVQRGDVADRLYFLVRGEVSVVQALPGGGVQRLSTLSAGMGFGELAMLGGGRRSADVRADTEVACWTLDQRRYAQLEAERPALALRLTRQLLLGAAETIARLSADVAALEA